MMIRSLFYIFALISPLSWTAPDSIHNEALKKRLDFLFRDSRLSGTEMSVEVFSLSQQKKLYSLNSEKSLSPASTVKMLTALVALKKLGPNFRFETNIYHDGSVKNGVLQGNLYIRGGGDPSLVTERLYQLVERLTRSGIREIRGNVYVDDTLFDLTGIEESRLKKKTDRAYDAKLSALSFNYNSTTLYFRPTRLGARPKVFVVPDTGYVKVKNSAKTYSSSRYRLIASRSPTKTGDLVTITGKIPRGMSEQSSYLNVTKPAIHAGYAFVYMLKKFGIKVKNQSPKKKKTPKNAKRLLSFKSLALREIVVLMNKFSNNLIADTLILTLGLELKGRGNVRSGIQVIKEEATRLGINYGDFKIVSGSGLTRKNKMSARHFIKLLNAAYLDFDVLPELLASMPIAGRDGTLKTRMVETSAFGRLRAKTGTIFGVSTLTGIVQSKGGDLLSFAVLMNDKLKNPEDLRPWQNYFGQALADYNRVPAHNGTGGR